jgi:hypothetical protein
MDLASLEWLHQKFAMPIYTGLGNGYYLPKHFHVIEMDWWQEIPFHDELKLLIHLHNMLLDVACVIKIELYGVVFHSWQKQDIVSLRVIQDIPHILKNS